MPKYHYIDVYGCVEPTAHGPFKTPEERDDSAMMCRRQQRDSDALFWLDIEDNGAVVVGAYGAGEVEVAMRLSEHHV
jgi:hypothetical protein